MMSKMPESSNENNSNTIEYCIHVTPLPKDITKIDIEFLFSLCGKVKSVSICKRHFNGSISSYYAYVHFFTLEAKEKAKNFFNGKMLGWIILNVADSIKRANKNTNFKKDNLDLQKCDQVTVYQEDMERSFSRPKKRVHKNENQDTESSFKKRYNNYDRQNDEIRAKRLDLSIESSSSRRSTKWLGERPKSSNGNHSPHKEYKNSPRKEALSPKKHEKTSITDIEY